MAIEDATEHSGQTWIAALNGTAAGGGYELALGCDQIVLVDDGSSAVSLPEVPLLGVLPGTGGLTRVVDKRHVRRDRADVFATKADGIKGQTAVEWGLVDAAVPRARFDQEIARSRRSRGGGLHPPGRCNRGPAHPARSGRRRRRHPLPLRAARLDRAARTVEITVEAPPGAAARRLRRRHGPGRRTTGRWRVARALDDLVLRLRTNEAELGTWVFRTSGDADRVLGVRRAAGRAGRRLVRRTRSCSSSSAPSSAWTSPAAA